MSNVKSDQLFKLVHSLSKAEKRFFKIYAGRQNGSMDKKFILLFDAIEKQKTYNEAKILNNEIRFNPRQFSNLKAHLYKLVLKSVRLCNTTDSIKIEIAEQLDFARILYSKCLYKECVKMLDKAKKTAIQHDSSILLLEILELEKLVLPKTIESKNQDRVNFLIETSNHVAESIRKSNVFSNLALKLTAYYMQTGFNKSQADLEKVKSYFYSSLPEYDENLLSFHEKLHLYHSYIGYYFYIQDFERGMDYALRLVELFEKHPEMKIHHLEQYIKALNSLLAVQNKLNRYSEFVATQKKLIALKRDRTLSLSENINLNLFKAIYIHEINRHFMLGEFRAGTRIVNALEDELNKFVPKLDRHSVLLFYYKIACLYIGSGNYRIAIKWLNNIYNEKEHDVREDLQDFTRILLLVCHFELNNDILLESTIRSTYRYFRKHGALSKYQELILHFLRNLFKQNTDKTLKDQFTQLKSDLEKLVHTPDEKRAFMYFDIISWLESKIQKKTVESIIKEKLRTKKALH